MFMLFMVSNTQTNILTAHTQQAYGVHNLCSPRHAANRLPRWTATTATATLRRCVLFGVTLPALSACECIRVTAYVSASRTRWRWQRHGCGHIIIYLPSTVKLLKCITRLPCGCPQWLCVFCVPSYTPLMGETMYLTCGMNTYVHIYILGHLSLAVRALNLCTPFSSIMSGLFTLSPSPSTTTTSPYTFAFQSNFFMCSPAP